MHPLYTPTAYCGLMTEHPITTAMIHYECGVCHIAATCVANGSAELAWFDHMATHAVETDYRAWTWSVLQLDLRITEPVRSPGL
jgi:hypothetical protein